MEKSPQQTVWLFQGIYAWGAGPIKDRLFTAFGAMSRTVLFTP